MPMSGSWSPQETVVETLRVNVVSRDSSRVVDALRKGPEARACFGASARSIERGEFAAGTAAGKGPVEWTCDWNRALMDASDLFLCARLGLEEVACGALCGKPRGVYDPEQSLEQS
jgi:hypothetical protein